MSKLVKKGIIPAVNYHLWKACNYKCKFCFGTFNDVEKNNQKKDAAILTMQHIVDFGFEKITFSGGEPLLCPFLPDLLKIAKEGGMTTAVVTNGTLLTDKWLKSNQALLDWIAISIDSVNQKSNIESGRNLRGKTISESEYVELIKKIKRYGYKLKINTVVSRYNVNEDMNEFINLTKPERWKIFQALPIKIQNEKFTSEFEISYSEYLKYLDRHKSSSYVKESNYDMKGSYVMIEPLGRFFNNSKGKYQYSSKINDVGVEKALNELNYCFKKFINREGLYEW